MAADNGSLVDGSKLEKSSECQTLESGKKNDMRKKDEVSKDTQQPHDRSRKKGEKATKGRNGLAKMVKGIVGGSVPVHVAS